MKNKKTRERGQAAIEFLMTYGWAFLIILVLVGTFMYFDVFNMDRNIPETCDIGTTGVNCPDFIVSTEEVMFGIRNNLGKTLTDLEVTLHDDRLEEPIICNFFSGDELSESTIRTGRQGTVYCPLEDETYSVGERFRGEIEIAYVEAGSAVTRTSTGKISAFINQQTLNGAETRKAAIENPDQPGIEALGTEKEQLIGFEEAITSICEEECVSKKGDCIAILAGIDEKETKGIPQIEVIFDLDAGNMSAKEAELISKEMESVSKIDSELIKESEIQETINLFCETYMSKDKENLLECVTTEKRKIQRFLQPPTNKTTYHEEFDLVCVLNSKESIDTKTVGDCSSILADLKSEYEDMDEALMSVVKEHYCLITENIKESSLMEEVVIESSKTISKETIKEPEDELEGTETTFELAKGERETSLNCNLEAGYGDEKSNYKISCFDDIGTRKIERFLLPPDKSIDYDYFTTHYKYDDIGPLELIKIEEENMRGSCSGEIRFVGYSDGTICWSCWVSNGNSMVGTNMGCATIIYLAENLGPQ